MATTTNLGMTLVSASQSQKETTVNNALYKIDALLNRAAEDKDLATPPGSPAEGDLYIVASSGTGDWSGHDGDIAYYLNSAWAFIDPNEGLTVWVADEDALYTFDGSAWVSSGKNIQNAALLGINTTADSTNKLAVASVAILFTNIGDDCQVKINKAAAGDTASFLFQTNFSGRAEFGLTGDDDFHLKVSPDGSSFYEAFVIDKDTGDAAFQQFVGLGTATELTIASGAVTATRSSHTIDNESDAASDDLDTISGGTTGDMLILQAENTARTVVLKDGTGNLKLAGDFSLDNTEDRIMLIKDGSNWVEISRSDNGA